MVERRRWASVVLACVAAGCGSGGPPDLAPGDGGLAGDASGTEPLLETHAPGTVMAGEVIPVDCRVTTGGEPVSSDAVIDVVYEPSSLVEEDEDGRAIAIYAGEVSVRCKSHELGLLDQQPVVVTILPGPARRVFTELDSPVVTAGETVTARCIAFDAYGNEVQDADAHLAIDPHGDAATIEGLSVTARRAGLYTVTCDTPMAEEYQSASLDVVPALPADIMAAPAPSRDVYVIGDVVKVDALVVDRFGNRVVDATLAYQSSPTAQEVAHGRYAFSQDGRYTLSVQVTSPTEGGVTLADSFEVVVNSRGPEIQCLALTADCMQEADATTCQTAASTHTYKVRVADPLGVQSVSIGGSTATQSPDGTFTATIPVQQGMNFVNVQAVDELGEPSSRTCTFLAVSPEWCRSGTDFLSGAGSLRLDPEAVDDGATPEALDSLNDVVHTVLNSDGLVEIVDQALSDANPLSSGGCGFFACEPDINYTGGSLSLGGAETSLHLIPGGLRVEATISNASLTVRARGTFCCPGGTNISVTVNPLTAAVEFDLFLQGGVLRGAVRGSPSVTVGNISYNLSGFCGLLADLFLDVESRIESAVIGGLGGFLGDDLTPVIDGMLSGLDIANLGTSFDVPRLDGTGNVTLGFDLSLSSLDVATTRALIGFDTRFASSPAHARSSCVVVPEGAGSVLLDPNTTSPSQPVAVTAHVGILNQALYALWRGGFFDANMVLDDAGGLGDGVQVSLETWLPPVIRLAPGAPQAVEVMVGGIRAGVSVPGLLDEPLTVGLGAVITTDVSLSGEQLSFGGLTLQELHVTFENDATVSQEQRDLFEDAMGALLQSVIDESLNNALPAVPIPGFELPDIVADFGLPAGEELSLLNASLAESGQHFVLTGGFGLR